MATAFAATRAEDVLRGIEGSLVFLNSRYGAEREVEGARSAADPAEPAPVTPPPTAAGGSSMPPASAGSNGTPIPPPPPGTGRLTARAPVLRGADVNGISATYVSGIVLPAGRAAQDQRRDQRRQHDRRQALHLGRRPRILVRAAATTARARSASPSPAAASSRSRSTRASSSPGAAPGPGRWLTVYANAGHAFAVIAGFRWDTVGDARGTGPALAPRRGAAAGLRRAPPARLLSRRRGRSGAPSSSLEAQRGPRWGGRTRRCGAGGRSGPGRATARSIASRSANASGSAATSRISSSSVTWVGWRSRTWRRTVASISRVVSGGALDCRPSLPRPFSASGRRQAISSPCAIALRGCRPPASSTASSACAHSASIDDRRRSAGSSRAPAGSSPASRTPDSASTRKW